MDGFNNILHDSYVIWSADDMQVQRLSGCD